MKIFKYVEFSISWNFGVIARFYGFIIYLISNIRYILKKSIEKQTLI